jgi:hypothetical protein
LIHGTIAFSSGLILGTFNIDGAALYQVVESNVSSMLIFYTTQFVLLAVTVWLSNIFFKEPE